MKKQSKKPQNGNILLGLSLLSTELAPFALRISFFSATAAALPQLLDDAIALVSFLIAWFLLIASLLKRVRCALTVDSLFSAAVCTGIFCGPALYLEIMVFRASFTAGNLLPSGWIGLVLALAAPLAGAHTLAWLYLLVYAVSTGQRPFDSRLWITAWHILLRKPAYILLVWFSALGLLWVSLALFQAVAHGFLAFLYHTIWGTLLLIIAFDFVLKFLARQAFFCIGAALRDDQKRRAAVQADVERVPDPIEALYDEATLAVRKGDPSTAENILIDAGVYTEQDAYEAPFRVVRESVPDEAVQTPEPSNRHTSWLAALPLVLLLLFLLGNAAEPRSTAGRTVQQILDNTANQAAAFSDAGQTADAARIYTEGLADLTAIDAYLACLSGRTAEGASQDDIVAAYMHAFESSRSIDPSRSLSYLLEGKLLLEDGRPEDAIGLLESMNASGAASSDGQLLLLSAYRAAGSFYDASYSNTLQDCIRQRSFYDPLSGWNDLNGQSAAALSAGMASARETFYLQSQLLTWQAARERGDMETSFNGLYALMTQNEGAYATHLRVLESFILTGSQYHVRADGSTDHIAEYHALTAATALEYDRLLTRAKAAGEEVETSLENAKVFVAQALLSCNAYEEALSYLEEAIRMFPNSSMLRALYADARGSLPEGGSL